MEFITFIASAFKEKQTNCLVDRLWENICEYKPDNRFLSEYIENSYNLIISIKQNGQNIWTDFTVEELLMHIEIWI